MEGKRTDENALFMIRILICKMNNNCLSCFEDKRSNYLTESSVSSWWSEPRRKYYANKTYYKFHIFVYGKSAFIKTDNDCQLKNSQKNYWIWKQDSQPGLLNTCTVGAHHPLRIICTTVIQNIHREKIHRN